MLRRVRRVLASRHVHSIGISSDAAEEAIRDQLQLTTRRALLRPLLRHLGYLSAALLGYQPWAKFRLVPFPKSSPIAVRIEFAFTMSCCGKLIASILAALLHVL